MIRIAKLPFIYEDQDRWGRPQGTFSVMDVQGEIDEDMWTKIQEYEEYFLSEEAKEYEAITKAHLDRGNLNSNEIPNLPHMTKVIGYAKSLIWQFNLRDERDFKEGFEYRRSYAVFGEITLYPWTPEHDVKVNALKEQADKMSVK